MHIEIGTRLPALTVLVQRSRAVAMDSHDV